MKNHGECKKMVISLIYEVCDNEMVSFGDDENLYEAGILDSVTIMELIIQLETKFTIEFQGEDLYFDNFASVDNICNMVINKQQLEDEN